MAIHFEEMLKRYKAAKANKQQWESHIRECYRYAMPQRNTIDDYNPGQKKRTFVFDSTAEDALEDFATRMESELVPPNMNWMKLENGSEIPAEGMEKVNEYLEETTDICFNHINSSNFSAQIHESFLDLGISTGAIIVEAGDGIQSSLNFRCVSLSELYPEQSSTGIIETVFRTIKVTAQNVEETWSNVKLTDGLKQIIDDKPTSTLKFIEGVMKDRNGMFINFVAYEKEKTYLIYEELESNPYIIFRESTIPGETIGRGRVMRALPDIKSLNVMTEDFLRGLRWHTSPTFTAHDDGLINPHNFSLNPGSVNAVSTNARENPTLQALQVGGNPILLEEATRRLQDNIRRIMISKPFGNVEETPVRTATEMSIRNADMAKTSLGASGRIQNELLERLVARCVYVLKKAGKIADFKVDGKEVKIKFTSPSARSQDEQQLAALGRAMEMMVALPPELVNQEIAVEKIPGEIIDILGLPAKFKRSDEEKQMRAQQQQQAQAQERAEAQASVEEQQGGQ